MESMKIAELVSEAKEHFSAIDQAIKDEQGTAREAQEKARAFSPDLSSADAIKASRAARVSLESEKAASGDFLDELQKKKAEMLQEFDGGVYQSFHEAVNADIKAAEAAHDGLYRQAAEQLRQACKAFQEYSEAMAADLGEIEAEARGILPFAPSLRGKYGELKAGNVSMARDRVKAKLQRLDELESIQKLYRAE